MKLGISVNAFYCPYLLRQSLAILRPFAHYVNIVDQEISNTGIPRGSHYRQEYETLRSDGLCDELISYAPDVAPFRDSPKQNETDKRNVGLNDARENGCTHFMSMDEDEFYEPAKFELALRMIDGHYDASACQLQTYYRDPTIRLRPPEEYWCPFVYEISDRRFVKGLPWKITADPSRKMAFERMLIFPREHLEMHHHSYVRRSIREKLYNQSASVNFHDRIEEIATYWDDYVFPRKAYLGGSEKRLLAVERCENLFDLEV